MKRMNEKDDSYKSKEQMLRDIFTCAEDMLMIQRPVEVEEIKDRFQIRQQHVYTKRE